MVAQISHARGEILVEDETRPQFRLRCAALNPGEKSREAGRRSTIQDIANLADVSKVTVSYVLNGRSRTARISQETERRVLDAARELSYRPNNVARMLVTRKSFTLAVVFQYAELFSSGSGFINELMRGVCAASVKEGYDLMLHTKAVGSAEMEVDVLNDGRVDGALVLRDEGDATISGLLDGGMPTVLFFTRSNHPKAAWVDADNFSGGRLATEHLLDLGHRRIGMVCGPVGSVAGTARHAGYLAALSDAGLAPYPETPRCGSVREAEEKFADMLRAPDRPSAIFVWSDDVAITCLEVARGLGIRVPEQLSVVGFDSLDLCSRSVPPLTSVYQPIFDMAYEAVQLLVALCGSEEPSSRQICHPLRLDVRGSTAPFIH